jgi:hypothetical protein
MAIAFVHETLREIAWRRRLVAGRGAEDRADLIPRRVGPPIAGG